GIERGGRLRDAEVHEVGAAGRLRDRIIGAARPETLGVCEVVQVARILLELQAHLRREGVFLFVATVRLRRQEQLRAAGQRVEGELRLRIAHAYGRLPLIGERVRSLAEQRILFVRGVGLQ